MLIVSSTRRLADEHGLKAPFQRGVLLDVLAIFVQRRRADGVELAAREHRLEQVGRVHRAFRGARANHGVQLVDEEDDLSLGVGDFLQHRLEAFFELAAILRTGDECAHVERDDTLVAQAFGDVAADDALGETFDDRRLADARFANQHRVVFRPTREHLNDAANLIVASDDRIQLALARDFGEVAAVAFERLVLALGILVGDTLRPADGRQRLQQRVLGHAAGTQLLGGGGASTLGDDCEQQMLRARELVLEALGFLFGRGEYPAEARRETGLRTAVGLGQFVEHLLHVVHGGGGVDVHLAQHGWDDAVALGCEGHDEVLGEHFGMSAALGRLLGGQDGFLRFLRVAIEVHGRDPFVSAGRSSFRSAS